jgi:multisubunit Na+/H+ antiporter MnhF subunit
MCGTSVFHDASKSLKLRYSALGYDRLECKAQTPMATRSTYQGRFLLMDVKLVIVVLSVLFSVSCLFFGTKNGFYDSDDYHGNGSAH